MQGADTMDSNDTQPSDKDPSQFVYVDIGTTFQKDGEKIHSKWHRVKRADLPGAFERLSWGANNLFATILSYPNAEHVNCSETSYTYLGIPMLENIP